MTYIAAEPEVTTAYKDDLGGLHADRSAAISANFENDLIRAVRDYCEGHPGMPLLGMRAALKYFAKNNPDMLRILVGDRDAT